MQFWITQKSRTAFAGWLSSRLSSPPHRRTHGGRPCPVDQHVLRSSPIRWTLSLHTASTRPSHQRFPPRGGDQVVVAVNRVLERPGGGGELQRRGRLTPPHQCEDKPAAETV